MALPGMLEMGRGGVENLVQPANKHHQTGNARCFFSSNI